MKNEPLVKRIASARIDRLLSLAERRTSERTALGRRLANRYVRLAREISSHYKIKAPGLKTKTCKNCNNLLIPGINCRVNVASVHGYVAYVCECGKETRLHYRKRSSTR